MRIYKHTNGVYYASYLTRQGVKRISLRTRNSDEAKHLADDANLESLEHLVKADALTNDAVTRVTHGHRIDCLACYEAWQKWAVVVGLAPNTAHVYGFMIESFIRDNKIADKNPRAITDSIIASWVNAEGLSASARSGRLRAIRNFTSMLASKAYLQGDPSVGIKVRMGDLTFAQKEPKVREPLTDEEQFMLMSGVSDKWRVPVVLALDAGLRITDVACLEWDSIRGDGTLVVWADKFDKRIAMPMNRRLRTGVLSLERTHPRWVFPDLQKLAADLTTRAQLSTMFKRELERIGIDGKSFHNLRHTFATNRRNMGDTVDQIREKMGHSLETTTAGYIHTP